MLPSFQPHCLRFWRGVVGRALVLLASLAGGLHELRGQSVADSPGLSSQAFSPRSGPRAATLFTLLPPEQTGIHAANPYDDPSMWYQHYREFSLGAIGTGVAIGDFDGDGRPDIFVVSKIGRAHV